MPGIVMYANPTPGTSYRQEFAVDEAEDMAVVVAHGVPVTLGDGTEFLDGLKVLEWTPLEPQAFEWKVFVAGIGLVVEIKPATGERVEIVLP